MTTYVSVVRSAEKIANDLPAEKIDARSNTVTDSFVNYMPYIASYIPRRKYPKLRNVARPFLEVSIQC